MVFHYGIQIWADFSLVLSQFTGLTDGQIFIARPRLHSMQRGKNALQLMWSV